MKAIKAPVEFSSVRALEAGCDVVCHCNANMKEMAAIADALSPVSSKLAARFETIRVPVASVDPDTTLLADIDRRIAAL
jgi:beta-N-acetylhexosaminidase